MKLEFNPDDYKVKYYTMEGEPLTNSGERDWIQKVGAYHKSIWPKEVGARHPFIIGSTFVGNIWFKTFYDGGLDIGTIGMHMQPMIYRTDVWDMKTGNMIADFKWPGPKRFAKVLHRQVIREFSEGNIFEWVN